MSPRDPYPSGFRVDEGGNIIDPNEVRATQRTYVPPLYFDPAFHLHGKTVQGTMSMGEVYALDFTDGTHLWLSITHHGPQEGGRVSIQAELRDGSL